MAAVWTWTTTLLKITDRSALQAALVELGPWAIVVLGLSAGVYQPLGPDVFVISSSLIGIPSGQAAVLAALATAGGASFGYALGAGLLGPVLGSLLRRRAAAVAKVRTWLARRGLWVVALAGFSPVPLTQVSWAAGGLRMPFSRFVAGLFLGLVPRFFLEAVFAGVLRRWLG